MICFFNMYLLLSKYPDVLHKYQHKFRYILVDEFQDTNFAQYAVLKNCSAAFENICGLGWWNRFTRFGEQTFKTYFLLKIWIWEFSNSSSEIYRSTKTSFMQRIMWSTKTKANSKNVWTENDMGEKISHACTEWDNEEGVLVASSILKQKLTGNGGIKDFAILYRTNAQSRAMEKRYGKWIFSTGFMAVCHSIREKRLKNLLAYFSSWLIPMKKHWNNY